MKINTTIIVYILVLFSTFALCKDSPRKWKMSGKQDNIEQSLYQQKQYTFDQILDHSNYQNVSYWKQRYWAVNDYFKPNSGPVFLFICGQYTCPGVPVARQWIVNLAQRTLGLILVVEHRFYGKSMPFGNNSMKLQNLKYLTSQQALSDLAYFINQVNQNKMYGVNQNPWITIGGSYPGALSAWFRYKYPHLTIGAIASSAVVQSIQDFKDYDQQCYISTKKSGDYCWQAINKTNSIVQSILNSNNSVQFKAQFQYAQNLKDDQFLFFWIDSIIDKIQYGKRTQLCNDIKGKNDTQLLNYFISLAKGNDASQYGAYYLKNQTFCAQKAQGARSWNYQCCTQFGYWQTTSLNHSLRSKKINIDFYKRFCAQIFGEGVWPKVNRKNTQTGGWKLEAFNLLMSNGDQDPWKWASIQKSQGQIIARVANCTDCAHCVDLYTPSKNDSAQLKKIRDQQFLTIQNWIQTYWRNHKASKISKMFNKILSQF